MFRTVPLSIIRSFFHCTHSNGICQTGTGTGRQHRGCIIPHAVPSWFCSQAVSKPLLHIPFLCVQWKTPYDGQRNCPKHVEFHSENKFEKLAHQVGFIIRNLSRCTVTWMLFIYSKSNRLSKQVQPQNRLFIINTLRTGEADLRFYITTVQDGWRKSAFLTRACFSCTIHLIMQYIEPVSEWFCWRMFIEIWPHPELTFRHRASSI